jgi:phage terminase large subunit-like protein
VRSRLRCLHCPHRCAPNRPRPVFKSAVVEQEEKQWRGWKHAGGRGSTASRTNAKMRPLHVNFISSKANSNSARSANGIGGDMRDGCYIEVGGASGLFFYLKAGEGSLSAVISRIWANEGPKGPYGDRAEEEHQLGMYHSKPGHMWLVRPV